MKVRIVCNAIFLSALGLGIVAAQAQNQPPALPTGQPSTPMGGMSEMHKPAPPAGPLEIKFGDNDNLSSMVVHLADADLLVILSDMQTAMGALTKGEQP